MTTASGGTAVRSGYYWNAARWSVVPVARDGDVLPGDPRESYRRVPLALALALVPLMGALFVFFLPFVGFALTFHALVLRVGGAFRSAAERLATTVTPGWQPGEAHLTGKRGAGGPARAEGRKGSASEVALSRLLDEVERRRRQGEGDGR